MPAALLADIILVVHFSIVAFIVIGELLILVGWWRRWQWVRNPWFRWLHLFAIFAVVMLGFVIGYCPLTEWEYELRESIGQAQEPGSFVGRLIHQILFVELPEWVFQPLYVAFGLLVLATMWFYRPRRFKSAMKHER